MTTKLTSLLLLAAFGSDRLRTGCTALPSAEAADSGRDQLDGHDRTVHGVPAACRRRDRAVCRPSDEAGGFHGG